MNIKSLATLCFASLSLALCAQQKIFSTGDVSCRNASGEWLPANASGGKIVRLSGDDIQLQLDKTYQLHIYRTTHLPNRGAIHLCKDQRGNNVTVMLVNDDKLFLYADDNRYEISLKPRPALPARAAYADAGD